MRVIFCHIAEFDLLRSIIEWMIHEIYSTRWLHDSSMTPDSILLICSGFWVARMISNILVQGPQRYVSVKQTILFRYMLLSTSLFFMTVNGVSMKWNICVWNEMTRKRREFNLRYRSTMRKFRKVVSLSLSLSLSLPLFQIYSHEK